MAMKYLGVDRKARPVDLIAKGIERLAFISILLGATGLVLSMVLAVSDVISTLFDSPIPGALEFTESSMVLVVFGGLAYAQARRQHFRVEILISRTGPKTRSLMDITAAISGIIFFSLLVWQGWNEAIYSLGNREATSGLIQFPLYPARFIMVFGASLLVLQFFVDLTRSVQNFGGGAKALGSSNEAEFSLF